MDLTFALACYRGYDKEENLGLVTRIKCVKALVEAGANINFTKEHSKLTALHWTAYNNYKNSAIYLLNRGA
jgi:ankyrin repeat protein